MASEGTRPNDVTFCVYLHLFSSAPRWHGHWPKLPGGTRLGLHMVTTPGATGALCSVFCKTHMQLHSQGVIASWVKRLIITLLDSHSLRLIEPALMQACIQF